MAIEDTVCLAQNGSEFGNDFEIEFKTYKTQRYLQTRRAQLTARFCSDVYQAKIVTRELRYLSL